MRRARIVTLPLDWLPFRSGENQIRRKDNYAHISPASYRSPPSRHSSKRLRQIHQPIREAPRNFGIVRCNVSGDFLEIGERSPRNKLPRSPCGNSGAKFRRGISFLFAQRFKTFTDRFRHRRGWFKARVKIDQLLQNHLTFQVGEFRQFSDDFSYTQQFKNGMGLRVRREKLPAERTNPISWILETCNSILQNPVNPV